ncbi:inositol monophosphatase family protein [Priestia taiwanensis]
MENVTVMREQAMQWIKEASAYIHDSFQSALTIDTKSNASDLVTNIDQEVEKLFINRIRVAYPEHAIVGEEGFGDEIERTDGYVWVIDPIDGTMNFIHQQRNFAISLALYIDGKGVFGIVYDVAANDMYYAISGEGAYMNGTKIARVEEGYLEQAVVSVNATWLTENRRLDHEKIAQLVRRARGTRSYGCAALEMMYVVTGKLDAYMTPRLAPWDFAAGAIMANEVGVIATTLKGEPLSILHKSGLLIARRGVHEDMLTNYIVCKE